MPQSATVAVPKALQHIPPTCFENTFGVRLPGHKHPNALRAEERRAHRQERRIESNRAPMPSKATSKPLPRPKKPSRRSRGNIPPSPVQCPPPSPLAPPPSSTSFAPSEYGWQLSNAVPFPISMPLVALPFPLSSVAPGDGQAAMPLSGLEGYPTAPYGGSFTLAGPLQGRSAEHGNVPPTTSVLVPYPIAAVGPILVGHAGVGSQATSVDCYPGLEDPSLMQDHGAWPSTSWGADADFTQPSRSTTASSLHYNICRSPTHHGPALEWGPLSLDTSQPS
ncbi:hypothetical protein C8T65DRAFT_692621 [Cerioporus squamosus]|nr:hypothetical protein C8T65DRAFT_692621 [Cerioporus squamosus]